MAHGSPDWLMPTVPVNITLVEGEEPDINVEDSPIAQTWGWDPTGDGEWRKILVNADGKLIIDPSEIFENDPTNDEHGKAPDSDWAYDHKHDACAHHTPTAPGVTDHSELTGILIDDHHAPTVASDLQHNDLDGIGASDHHIKTTLHTEITDFHTAVQNTLGCKGVFVEKAPKLGDNTRIDVLVVFNNKLYGVAYPDNALYEWNGTNAWVEKAPKYGAESGGWSLCVFNGKIYAGTGINAHLLEWNGADAWVKKADGIGTAAIVLSLCVFKDKLYAGVNNDGALWEWNGANAWVKKASKHANETSISCLVVHNNKLYGGTQPNGILLEWNESSAWILKSQSAGIQYCIYSMAVHNSKLYVGSFNEGKLHEWNDVDELVLKAGQFETETTIESLISFNGSLYGGSGLHAYLLEWNGVDEWVRAVQQADSETGILSLCEFNDLLYGGTRDSGKLFLFNQPTLCEHTLDSSAHHAKTYKSSEITEGVFDRARLAGSTEGVVFYDRGEISSSDFVIGDLTLDATWNDLDLSSIVPAGSVAIYFRFTLRADTLGKFFQVRKNGNTSSGNVLIYRIMVVNQYWDCYGICFCDSDRKVEYNGQAGTFDAVYITIQGWWK